MKKGFTLSELLAVIVLLGAILLVIVPTVTKQLKEGKQEQYENQIVFIKQSLAMWASENYTPKVGETVYLTLSQLQESGLVSHDLKNPMTDEFFANDSELKIVNTDGIITYEVIEGDHKSDYLDIPKIKINGELIYKVELGSSYTDLGAEAYTKDGTLLDNLTSTNNVNTNVVGSYYVNYEITHNNKANLVKRTVIVADTLAPIISFDGDLTVALEALSTYDFENDIVITDSSDYTVEVETNFTNLKGNYSIKYIATDIYGNTSTKYRKVIVI